MTSPHTLSINIQLRALTCKCNCESFHIAAGVVIVNFSISIYSCWCDYKLFNINIAAEVMGGIQSRNSLDKEAEINTRAGDKKRMKKIDKDIRKTFFFDKDMVASKIDFDLN